MSLSVYGATGYIGRTFCNMFPKKSRAIDRGQRTPMDKDILYFISTTHNYNVFKEITLDVKSNLMVLTEVLDRVVEVKDRRFDTHEDITFNFISSWFVYGDANDNPVSEDGLCDPRGFYSITKRAAEQLIISFCETFGVKYRILRLCNVLGDNDPDASLQKNAITQMIDNMRNGQPIRLYNEGTDIRDILHVKDVCRAIDLVIEKGEKNQQRGGKRRKGRIFGNPHLNNLSCSYMKFPIQFFLLRHIPNHSSSLIRVQSFYFH